MIWLVPCSLVLLAVVPVFVGLRKVGQEVRALRREMTALAGLRGPVLELREDVQELRASVPEIRRRPRPGPSVAS